MNNKVEMLEKNLILNYNVVKCSHDYNVEKLICCLSTCIFPDKVTYPIDESSLHNGPPHHSNDAYVYSKRMLEIHCKAYRENYGDNFICVSPTNVYGHHDNFSLEDGHVLPLLIHKCYLAKSNNEDFVVRGTVSVNKLLGLIRYFQYTKIEDGIKKSVSWFIENKEHIKS